MWFPGVPTGVSEWLGGIPLGPSGTLVIPVIPEIPTGLSASPGNAVVRLSWTPGTDATTWTLYWSTTPGVTAADNAVPHVTSPYWHTGRTNGAHYYYRLSASTSAGESGLSTEVSATPQGPVGGLQTDWIT